jgi:ABC-type nitrate/sulfonate/bicarbonate transport system permease component
MALLLLWQAVAVTFVRDDQVLPTPGAVAGALVAQRALLWTHALVTLGETLVGFSAALVVGLALAAVIDLSPWLRRAFYPVLVISQTIPIITLAPLLVFWFGFGLTSKVIVVTLVCFFPIVVAAVDGLRGTDPEPSSSTARLGRARRASSGPCACPARCQRSFRACASPSPIA